MQGHFPFLGKDMELLVPERKRAVNAGTLAGIIIGAWPGAPAICHVLLLLILSRKHDDCAKARLHAMFWPSKRFISRYFQHSGRNV